MGVGDTNNYPSRSYPALAAQRAPGLPISLPGGANGPAPLPARAVVAYPNNGHGGILNGGAKGPINYFRPNINKSVPYLVGNTEGNVPALRAGIMWLRGFFNNTAGIQGFNTTRSATPNWTSDAPSDAPTQPAVPIPFSRKHFNYGGYRRQAYVDAQLFIQLPHWVIQRAIQARRTAAQPQQNSPYQPKLTQYTPAAAYGQTTTKLITPNLTNVLASVGSPVVDGGMYGPY